MINSVHCPEACSSEFIYIYILYRRVFIPFDPPGQPIYPGKKSLFPKKTYKSKEKPMRGGARNKFLFCNLCFRPVVDVDGVLDPCKGNSSGGHGNAVDKKRRERKQRLVPENVADDDSQPRSWNRSLSRILKAVVFESALVCIYLVPWFLSFLDRYKVRNSTIRSYLWMNRST